MADSLEKMFRALGIIDKQPDFSVADTLLAKLNGGMPQLDQFEAQSIGQILDYKNRYESAQKAYDTASRTFNDVNSTQAAKSQAQSDMAAAQHIMDEAHKGADFTRRVANNRGIDLSNYDAYNTSLDDANVNFVTKAQQDVSDLFAKDLTPDQFYDRTLRVLLSTGVHLNQAKAEAARRTRDYQIDRAARFNTAMQMYGQNGNGALTDLGIQMIGKFGKDSPELANLYAHYATPDKQYDNAVQAARDQNTQANAMLMALFSDKSAWNRMLQQALLNERYAAQQNDYQTQRDERQHGYTTERDKTLYEYDVKRDELQSQRKAEEKRQAEAAQAERERQVRIALKNKGLSDDDITLVLSGIKLPEAKVSKGYDDKEEYSRLKDRHKRLTEMFEKLNLVEGSLEYQAIRDALGETDKQLTMYELPWTDFEPLLTEEGNIPNDWETQKKIAQIMQSDLKARDFDDEQIAQAVYDAFIKRHAAEEIALAAANSVINRKWP